MMKQLSLPFELIKIIFFHNEPFIVQKILEIPRSIKNQDFQNKIDQKVVKKTLAYGVYFDTHIIISAINKEIYSTFNLKKAFYNNKYLIIDYRHETLNRTGKRDDSKNQPCLFHWICIYEINELLNHEDNIEINKLKPFLKLCLPIYHKVFLMKLFLFKNNTIIIKNKSYSNHYIYIDLNKNQLELIKNEQKPSTINTEHANNTINNSPLTIVHKESTLPAKNDPYELKKSVNNTKKPNSKVYFLKIIFGSLVTLGSFIVYLKYCSVNFSFA